MIGKLVGALIGRKVKEKIVDTVLDQVDLPPKVEDMIKSAAIDSPVDMLKKVIK
jgi:hypothetical protein